MSLHYLLDGYNILKQMPALADLPLEDGRGGFLRWLNIARPQGSVHNAVTVVFDGDKEVFGGPQGSGCVRVIFTDEGSADDKIKQMVERSQAKKNVVVVSNDKGIVLYVRALGARVLSVQEFCKIKGKPRPPRMAGASAGESPGKYISLAREAKINKELAGIWLKQ